MSVEQIMARADDEFASIFTAVYPNLCRFLECLLGASGAAQDVAQETFLRLYRFGLYRLPPGEARFWVYRVARNLALNELEKGRTRMKHFGKVVEAFRGTQANPEELFEQVERRRQVQELMKALPEPQRAALLLREQEEMSYSEIARVLNVSESKVKTDIFRARSALRARWNELNDQSAKTS
jgi:RNA polymerase sigma-70 factor (ECF subfamily)